MSDSRSMLVRTAPALVGLFSALLLGAALFLTGDNGILAAILAGGSLVAAVGSGVVSIRRLLQRHDQARGGPQA